MQKRKQKLTLLQRVTRFVIRQWFAIVFYIVSVIFVYMIWDMIINVFN